MRDTGGVLTSFAWDYFLKDHLGNVRMVLTGEQKTDLCPAATMEDGLTSTEEAIYSRLTETRHDLPSGYPTDNSYSNPNEKVARVIADENRIGPAITLKVMAGDKFNIRASSWYTLNQSPSGDYTNLIEDVVMNLAGGMSQLSGKATVSALTGSLPALGLDDFLKDQQIASDNSKPHAALNWLFFDSLSRKRSDSGSSLIWSPHHLAMSKWERKGS